MAPAPIPTRAYGATLMYADWHTVNLPRVNAQSPENAAAEIVLLGWRQLSDPLWGGNRDSGMAVYITIRDIATGAILYTADTRWAAES